jgi:hypothetical protein
VGEGVVQVGHERHGVVALLARELAVGAGVRDDDPVRGAAAGVVLEEPVGGDVQGERPGIGVLPGPFMPGLERLFVVAAD